MVYNCFVNYLFAIFKYLLIKALDYWNSDKEESMNLLGKQSIALLELEHSYSNCERWS